MAIVDATRELEPRERAPIGWDGRRLDEMLAESERLFAETGSYAGLDRRAGAQGLGPDRVREAVQPPARRSGLGARDGAQHLRLADRPRARRALLRALHARGRLDRALDRDHRPRPHDVGRDQVDGPPGLRGQPADPAGRHLRQQRPDDRRRPQRRRADLRPDLLGGDELVAWAGGVTHVLDIGASTPGGVPVGPTHRLDDGIDLPCMKIGEGDEIARWHLERCAKQTRAPMYYLLDERTRLAGCHMVREAVERVIARGGGRPLQAVQPRGDRGGPALVQVADPRDDRARAATAPPRSRTSPTPTRSSCRRGRGATSSCTRRSRSGSAATATTRSTSTAPRPGAGTR